MYWVEVPVSGNHRDLSHVLMLQLSGGLLDMKQAVFMFMAAVVFYLHFSVLDQTARRRG